MEEKKQHDMGPTGYFSETITLDEIKALKPSMIYYAMGTCWWAHDKKYLYKHANGLPCGPRGEMLMQTDDPMGFIAEAEKNPSFYGKHGLLTFMAANCLNCQVSATDSRPTSFKKWDEYDAMVQRKIESGEIQLSMKKAMDQMKEQLQEYVPPQEPADIRIAREFKELQKALQPAEEYVPEGYYKIEANAVYHNGTEIIILGVPYRGDHNCDMNGCGSLDHVIYRGSLELIEVECTSCDKILFYDPQIGSNYIVCPHCGDEWEAYHDDHGEEEL